MKRFRFFFGMAGSLALLASCGGPAPTPSSESSPSEESSQTSSSQTSSEESKTSAEPSYTAPDPVVDEVGVLRLHYHRADGNYAPWNLWLWSMPNGSGQAYQFNGLDSFGAYLEIGLSTWNVASATDLTLGYIVRTDSWEKDVEADRSIAFASYTPTEEGLYEFYLKSGDETLYDVKPDPESISKAAFTKVNEVTVKSEEKMSAIALYDGEMKILEKADLNAKEHVFVLSSEGQVDHSYAVEATFPSGAKIRRNVDISLLFDSSSFDEKFVYNGHDLGATYTKEKTTWKVWSPVSKKIVLRTYESGTPESLGGSDSHVDHEMTRGEKGVYSITLNGDYAGTYYNFVAYNAANPNGKEAVDPYAKSAGVNGLRGMVVDFDSTNPEGWASLAPAQIDRKALTVYETHVADVTSSSTWGGDADKAKKFLGLAQTGTKYEGVTTGFDHIKELGVNAVQLLPIFDQDNDELNVSFNWGYNPLNYNVLEGCYSSDPKDGYARIREFKTVVAEYLKSGINIIMDVVYNHVSNAGTSSFETLVPGYFYRLDALGKLSNGSGCGNETASDRAMFRNFMIDSTAFWAKEYKLGGFRFDLMGLHDVETMNQLTANLKAINPGIVVYGEPWTGGTTPLPATKRAAQNNLAKFEGYGAFNDKVRDSLIAGGLAGKGDRAWADGYPAASTTNALIAGIKGGISSTNVDPDKAVSYVTCHDNYTLYDRFVAAGVKGEDTLRHEAMLAESAVALSQGTFFMLAGEEFLRTKGGDDNSYQSSYKVNELDYSLKVKNADVMAHLKKLIGLKQSAPGLHLAAAEAKAMEIQNEFDGYCLTYTFLGAGNKTYKVALASPMASTSKKAPITADFTGYTLLTSSYGSATLSGATELRDAEVIVAVKG